MTKTTRTQKPTGTPAAMAREPAAANTAIGLFAPGESSATIFRRAAENGPVDNSRESHGRLWQSVREHVMGASANSITVTSDVPTRFRVPLRIMNAKFDAQSRRLSSILRRPSPKLPNDLSTAPA